MSHRPLIYAVAGLAMIGGSLAFAEDESFLEKSVMIDAANGWWQKVGHQKSETLHTTDGGKTWQNVTPKEVGSALSQQWPDHLQDEFLSGLVCLDPLDARKAWLAVPEDKQMFVAYTDDGGQHWQEHTVPVVDDAVDIDFFDAKRGFLLATSYPAAGHMDKQLFGTADGGQTWQKLAVPDTGGYYAGGISFRTPLQGWLSGSYHGGDSVPIYRTQDGGKSWALQSLPEPEPFKGKEYYGEPALPEFKGPDRQHGTLNVSYKQHVNKPYFEARVTYHSEDGGQTWQLPPEGVQTVPAE